MELHTLNCGRLTVKATEMIKPWTADEIRKWYPVDEEGNMKLAMNALLIRHRGKSILLDPGTADYLPARLKEEYGYEPFSSLEVQLEELGADPGRISDVIFTHLHFDHGSAAFKRIPGQLVKRFPQARYHVLKAHFEYARKPRKVEANSFFTFVLKYLDRVYWIEDWDIPWLKFRVYQGHTRGMLVPEIDADGKQIFFCSDLIPMEAFLDPRLYCGYDLDPDQQLREKEDFLSGLEKGSQLYFYHDTRKQNMAYA